MDLSVHMYMYIYVCVFLHTYIHTYIQSSLRFLYLDELREHGRRPRGDGRAEALPRHGEGGLDGGQAYYDDRWSCVKGQGLVYLCVQAGVHRSQQQTVLVVCRVCGWTGVCLLSMACGCVQANDKSKQDIKTHRERAAP